MITWEKTGWSRGERLSRGPLSVGNFDLMAASRATRHSTLLLFGHCICHGNCKSQLVRTDFNTQKANRPVTFQLCSEGTPTYSKIKNPLLTGLAVFGWPRRSNVSSCCAGTLWDNSHLLLVVSAIFRNAAYLMIVQSILNFVCPHLIVMSVLADWRSQQRGGFGCPGTRGWVCVY